MTEFREVSIMSMIVGSAMKEDLERDSWWSSDSSMVFGSAMKEDLKRDHWDEDSSMTVGSATKEDLGIIGVKRRKRAR